MVANTFISDFVDKAQLFPFEIAIKSENEEITYANLLKSAQMVKDFLLNENSIKNWVLIDAQDGIKSYIWIVGTWLAGKGYVPINLDYPINRISYCMNLVEGNKILSSKSSNSFKTINPLINDNKPSSERIQSNNAYLIFTSGTTGIPKAVPISNSNLNGFLQHYKSFDFNGTDQFLQTYELTFDVSVFVFCSALMSGGTLHLLPQKGIKFLNILQAIKKCQITVISMVPSILFLSRNYLEEMQFTSLRFSFFSGETLTGTLAKKWMKTVPNAKVFNCYGPSETTIVCTEEYLNNLDKAYFTNEALPLGSPISNCDIKIVEGEICIAGPLVFTNYLNETSETIEIDNRKYFKSGDIGFKDKNGKLLFKGRKDNQVQVNGFRVELESIDKLILNEFNIRSKSIKSTDSKSGDFIFTILEGKYFNEEAIISKVKEMLPPYSIPKRFQLIEQFPLNENGKLDVVKLKGMVNILNNK